MPSKFKRFFHRVFCCCCGQEKPISSLSRMSVDPEHQQHSKSNGDVISNVSVSDKHVVNARRVRDMRQAYMGRGESFTEAQLVTREPIGQFNEWFQLACQTKGIVEPNAMCLATATKDGKPSNRMVLLKGYSDAGFKFYTNYDSRKGQEIAENPHVAINFFWEPLKKAVRIEGIIEKLSSEESTEYFHSRPIGSQIGSAISPQSQPIEDRNYLMEKESDMLKLYSDKKPVPRPESWGGYIIIPHTIEFWQGHVDRIHDRIRFRRPKSDEIPDGKLLHQGDNGWVMERLGP